MDKKLNHYDVEEVLETFDIQLIDDCQILDAWVNATPSELMPIDKLLLDELPLELRQNERNWNEEELKMKFISPVFRVARLYERHKIDVFYERSMSGVVREVKISLILDCMVATPKNSGRPASPYFFLQEYKRSKGDSHDPEGQMLAAMILAQEMNHDGHPMYGCWLQGKNWYFTVLNGVEYCVSRQFDATQERDLLQIVFILRKLKALILARL